jgi:cytochrome c-type biogenesis protein CcmE
MFREGIGVVVEGAYQSDMIFRTNRLMVNHSNEYRAPTDGGMPDEAWKKSLTQADPPQAR